MFAGSLALETSESGAADATTVGGVTLETSARGAVSAEVMELAGGADSLLCRVGMRLHALASRTRWALTGSSLLYGDDWRRGSRTALRARLGC